MLAGISRLISKMITWLAMASPRSTETNSKSPISRTTMAVTNHNNGDRSWPTQCSNLHQKHNPRATTTTLTAVNSSAASVGLIIKPTADRPPAPIVNGPAIGGIRPSGYTTSATVIGTNAAASAIRSATSGALIDSRAAAIRARPPTARAAPVGRDAGDLTTAIPAPTHDAPYTSPSATIIAVIDYLAPASPSPP